MEALEIIAKRDAIIEKYGKPDEIRVELARELKQSKDERNETDKAMSKRQRENETIGSQNELITSYDGESKRDYTTPAGGVGSEADAKLDEQKRAQEKLDRDAVIAFLASPRPPLFSPVQ